MTTVAHDVVCKLVGAAATVVLVAISFCERRRGPYDPFTV